MWKLSMPTHPSPRPAAPRCTAHRAAPQSASITAKQAQETGCASFGTKTVSVQLLEATQPWGLWRWECSEVRSSRLTFSANTTKEKQGNGFSTQDTLVPPVALWKSWSAREVQSAQIQTVPSILQLQTDGKRHQMQNLHERGKIQDSDWASTVLQLLLDHNNNVSATHPASQPWAEPADRRSQSQTQSLAHTRFPPA